MAGRTDAGGLRVSREQLKSFAKERSFQGVHGIDMEIEFKQDDGTATGKKLYLQLKSGDSYLEPRKRDGIEIYKIGKQRHIKY